MVDDTTVGTRNPAPKRDVWKPLQSYGINHRPQVVTAGFLKHQQFLRHFQGWLCWICWSRHLLVSFPTRWCGDVSFKLKKNQQQSCPLERATTYNSGVSRIFQFFLLAKKISQDVLNNPKRPPYSPVSLSSSAALQYWQRSIDFFVFPGVELFGSIAHLLNLLVEVWKNEKVYSRGTERWTYFVENTDLSRCRFLFLGGKEEGV